MVPDNVLRPQRRRHCLLWSPPQHRDRIALTALNYVARSPYIHWPRRADNSVGFVDALHGCDCQQGDAPPGVRQGDGAWRGGGGGNGHWQLAGGRGGRRAQRRPGSRRLVPLAPLGPFWRGTILANYPVSAIDSFLPYFQDQVFHRLMPHISPWGRLYVVGLQPIPTATPVSPMFSAGSPGRAPPASS